MISKGCTSIFPIQYPTLWELYKQHTQSFWVAEEVSFVDDIRDLEKLDKDNLHFLKTVLTFFANSEAMINENLTSRFYNEVLIPEARAFIGMQIANETIHAETYALQIETYIKDNDEKVQLFDAINNVPCVNKKALWVSKWLNGKQNLLTRLIAFGIVEGLFFAGSFCAIYYFRQNGLLPGLSTSNDWIARDEGLHFTFSAELYKVLNEAAKQGTLDDTMVKDVSLVKGEVTQREFESIIKEAVEVEQEFVKDALPVDLLGMNSDLMSQYIEAVADRLADIFGFKRVYNTENPFDFMRALDLEATTNFFERTVTSYAKPTDVTINNQIDDDF